MSVMLRTLARQLNTRSHINMAKRYMQTTQTGNNPASKTQFYQNMYQLTGCVGAAIGFGYTTEWYKNDLKVGEFTRATSPNIVEYGFLSLGGACAGFLYPLSGVVWLGYKYVTYDYDPTKKKDSYETDSLEK